jgi:penicillin-binding protein 1A
MTEAPALMNRDTQRPSTDIPVDANPTFAQTPPTTQGEAAACDVQACARTYQSFRASDCSYQPFGSFTRRLCEKASPRQATPAESSSYAQSSPDQAGKAQCNLAVCSSFYESFNPGDCTYQPYGGGPRRVCTR